MMDTIKKYRRLLAWIAAPFLILCCWIATYFVAGITIAPETKASWLASIAVLSNLAATVIAFLIASVLFSQEDSAESEKLARKMIKEVLNESLLFVKEDADRFEQLLRRVIVESTGSPATLGEVRWVELIENADEIDFVVQGWDAWGDSQDIANALTNFFLRKGRFRLYVCNPDADSRSMAILAQRLNRSPGETIAEIKGTFRKINEAFERIPVADRGPPIELIETDNLNWYFAALFTGKSPFGGNRVRDVLLLSVYAHTRRRSWDMPVLVIHPDMQRNDFRDWFHKELQYLRDGVPRQGAPGETATDLPATLTTKSSGIQS